MHCLFSLFCLASLSDSANFIVVMALCLSYDNTVLKHCMMFWYLDMLCYYCCSLWFGVVACCCCGTHLTVTIHQLQDIASADADESLNIRQEADSTKRWIQNQCTTYTSSRDFQRPYKFWSQGPKTLFKIEVFGRTAALWDQVWSNILSDRIDSQGNTSKAIALIWKWYNLTVLSQNVGFFDGIFGTFHATSRYFTIGLDIRSMIIWWFWRIWVLGIGMALGYCRIFIRVYIYIYMT